MTLASDTQYQRLHQEIGVQHAWASWVCETLGCGAFDPDSLIPFATRFVGDREADQRWKSDDAWWFDTEAGSCVMLTHEVQTRHPQKMHWRIWNYLSGLVLKCEDGGHYQRGTRYIPLPIMIVLYRGAEPWTPPPEHVLPPPHQAQVRAWFEASPAYVFDMHHMAEGDIPTQATLRLIFDLERMLARPTHFVGSLAQRIRALPSQAEIAALYGPEQGQALVAALARFAHTAVRRWPSLPTDWHVDKEATLAELAKIGYEVALRYPSLDQESWMKGREEGQMAAQLTYLVERHGAEARQAVMALLPSLPPRTWLTYDELDDLVRAWTTGMTPEVWWQTHRPDRAHGWEDTNPSLSAL